ncbi:exocyst complex component EXO70H1 [Carica papaya]|uniref:exocyst complex component EXO70H1 n=1 Tax=Carica papaya TaxID=3649 RepID=UPI000B8D1708|nr:exocyst complex component EXO70H1 [Carica papaya]
MGVLGTARTNTVMGRKVLSTLFFPSSKSLLPSSSSIPSGSAPPTPVHHAFSHSMMEETIETAESIITKWDTNSSTYTKVTSIFQHNRKEAKQFLKSVKDLRRAMHFFVSEDSTSDKLVLAQNLMQTAMKRLENEFYLILSSNRDKLDPESVSSRSSDGSSNSDDEHEMVSEDEADMKKAGESITEVEKDSILVMSDLKAVAECMISCGYGKECIRIYKLIRKSIIDEGLYLLGMERIKNSHIQKMDGEALEHVTKKWLNAIKIAVKTLLNGEKMLCDYVFSASKTIRESCFYEISKEKTITLFRFPEIISKKKKLPGRIFRLMELHQAISELWQDIELIFNSELTSVIKLQALSSLHKLADTVCSLLLNFESTIQRDSSKTIPPGGGIHLLARSAMSYICSLAEHSGILSDILADHPLPRNSPVPESCFENPASEDGLTPAASTHLAWLILALLCKLDRKAELYNDISMSYLFLANNLLFIVNEVQTTHLHNVLGDEWVARHIKKVKLYASSYEATAWTKVLSSLPEKGSTMVSPEVAKEHFRQFNAAFEAAYMKQISWIVPDRKLRDELKLSIEKKLVPAYREFYGKYLGVLNGEKNLAMLVRFGPDDLENYLSDLFHGTHILDGFSSTSSSCHSRVCIPP